MIPTQPQRDRAMKEARKLTKDILYMVNSPKLYESEEIEFMIAASLLEAEMKAFEDNEADGIVFCGKCGKKK